MRLTGKATWPNARPAVIGGGLPCFEQEIPAVQMAAQLRHQDGIHGAATTADRHLPPDAAPPRSSQPARPPAWHGTAPPRRIIRPIRGSQDRRQVENHRPVAQLPTAGQWRNRPWRPPGTFSSIAACPSERHRVAHTEQASGIKPAAEAGRRRAQVAIEQVSRAPASLPRIRLLQSSRRTR